jgi:hypothetical protein
MSTTLGSWEKEISTAISYSLNLLLNRENRIFQQVRKMPYDIIKRIKLLRKPTSSYLPIYGIDLEDDKTWGYYKLYRSPAPSIRGEAVRLLGLDGTRKDDIRKTFDFMTECHSSYIDGGGTSETRLLYIPSELAQEYGIDDNMAIELLLKKVVYYLGGNQKQELEIYPSKLAKGPMDVKPKDDNEIDIKKFTQEYPSTANQWNVLLELMKRAQHLGLGINWMLSAISLQLQEIAIFKCAKKLNIKLDKKSVEQLLNREIKEETTKYLHFRDQYDAFSLWIEKEKNIEMPKLTIGLLREMRAEVVHRGYNPQPEETNAITKFTEGFLDKLKEVT